MQDLADRPPFDPELFAQLVHRGACLVAGYEPLYLVCVKLPGGARNSSR